MEVHFAPDIEAQLQQLAISTGMDAGQLVKDAAERLLQEDIRFRDAVRKGIEQADRGEFIEEEEMNARVERMFQS
jgi:predicted transcriptional regulator